MSLFKMKEPVQEVVNNHVERTVLEAKYTIKDLTLAEVTLIRLSLNRLSTNRTGYYLDGKTMEELLMDKIQV